MQLNISFPEGLEVFWWDFPANFSATRQINGYFWTFSGSHPDHDSDFDEFSDGIFTPSDDKANSEDSGSTKNSGGPSHHVVTVTTGGGSGVNGFLSGSSGSEYCLLTSFLNCAHFPTSCYILPVGEGKNDFPRLGFEPRILN